MEERAWSVPTSSDLVELWQLRDADLKLYAEEFNILHSSLNTWRHLHMKMVTKPRVTRCRQ
jgi:hypothetical protein